MMERRNKGKFKVVIKEDELFEDLGLKIFRDPLQLKAYKRGFKHGYKKGYDDSESEKEAKE